MRAVALFLNADHAYFRFRIHGLSRKYGNTDNRTDRGKNKNDYGVGWRQ